MVATILALMSSSISEAGYTAMLSPEWIPVRSTCSMMPGIRMSSPSQMASTSISMPDQVLVDEHRVVLLVGEDDGHVFLNILVAIGDDHVLAAQHVGGPHQHRISQIPLAAFSASSVVMMVWPLGRLICGPLQQLVEPLPVLGHIDAVCGSTQDGNIVCRQRSWSA